MSDEERLSLILHEHVPQPPRELTISDIAGAVSHPPIGPARTWQPRRLLAIAASIALVVGVAVTTVLTIGRRHEPPAKPSQLNAPGLVDTNWTLVAASYRHGKASPAEPSLLRIEKDGTITTTGSCGSVTVGHASISRSTFTAHQRPSPPNGDLIGGGGMCAGFTGFDLFLAGPVQWRVTGHDLTLSDSTATWFYRNIGANSLPAAIVGRWQLATPNVDTGLLTSPASRGVYVYQPGDSLLIDTAGHYVLDQRCYSTSGTLTVAASTLTVTSRHSTSRPACAQLISKAEAAHDRLVQRTLSGRFSWHIDTETLVVTKGSTVLRFIRTASEPNEFGYERRELPGTTWTILSEVGAEASAPIAVPTYVVSFDTTGTHVTISGAGFRQILPIKVGLGTLAIEGQVSPPDATCNGAVHALAMLSGPRYWGISGGRLRILNTNRGPASTLLLAKGVLTSGNSTAC